jgi:ATP-binding cassette subfamily F protein uup
MEARILEAEARLESCHEAMANPAVAADHIAVQERLGALTLAQDEVDRLYARWAELEARVKP